TLPVDKQILVKNLDKVKAKKKLTKHIKRNKENLDYFDSTELSIIDPTGEALELSPVELHYITTPRMVLYDWQAEELLRLHGHLDANPESKRFIFDADNPCLYILCAGNGVGKDEIVLARFAVTFALTNYKARVIITTSSKEQLLRQTGPHCRSLVARVNKIFGKVFRSTQVHHFCELTGSEIALFVTDEAGRAEGYHPWTGGKMVLGVNEAKSVPDEIFEALHRCTGYSHFLQVSSPPTKKAGEFYRDASQAREDNSEYPNALEPNKWYLRQVSAFECPHIPRSHLERMLQTRPRWWIRSSIYADLPEDENDPSIVIPSHLWNDLLKNPPAAVGSDIGIGLD
ncbi:hypothetical protein D6833_00855, partial [Candidatus Parcubacteria bacterium]